MLIIISYNYCLYLGVLKFYEVIKLGEVVKTLLIVLSLVIVGVINCGCMDNKLKEPTFTVDSIDFKGVGFDTTNLSIRLIIDNPNPIGVHVNKIVFDIYYIDNNGNSKYLGHGEKNNIDIRSGQTAIDIPITLSNKKLIEALEKNKNNKITLEIDGSANVDLKITSVDIPFKTRQTVRLPEGVVSYLETAKKMGIGFPIEDFKKPKVTVDKVEFKGISEDFKNTKLSIRFIVENPNPIDINLKNVIVYTYYYNKDGKHYFGSAKSSNIAIKSGISTPIYIDMNISNEDVVNAILSNKDNKKLTVKIEGSIDMEGIKKYGIPELKIPFENTKEIQITDNMIKLAETAKNKLGIGYTIEEDFKKPKVTIGRPRFCKLDLQNIYLEVPVIIDNPNPISININEIDFDVYYIDNGKLQPLGHGEKHNIHIRKYGNTTEKINVSLENYESVFALIKLAKDDKVTLIIDGTAHVDEIKKFNIPAIEVPFKEKKDVSVKKLKEPVSLNNESDGIKDKISNVIHRFRN